VSLGNINFAGVLCAAISSEIIVLRCAANRTATVYFTCHQAYGESAWC
jgi:hypothetical protein